MSIPTLPKPSRTALIGFAVFIAASLLGGDNFPFTRDALSTESNLLSETSRTVVLLRIRVDGERADLANYERFDGLSDSLAPAPSGDWTVASLATRKFLADLSERSIQRVFQPIHDSKLPPGDPPGPHSVELGMEIHRITSAGKDAPIWIPLQRGTAWPAS